MARIDAPRKAVTLDNGEEVSFDKMLLATGATPTRLKIPGADLPNIFYLRTIEDADRLIHAMETARGFGSGRAAVIGSGLLGTEVAATLTLAGMHVDVIESESRSWPKLAGENTGAFLSRYLEKHGVTMHLNETAIRLEGDGRVQRVVTTAGPNRDIVPCDFVVAAVGSTINRELLRNTPIASEMAILVDEHCQTSVSDIYAAGDCAAIFDPLFSKHRLIDHWDNARYTGNLAGTNMAGGDERYNIVNHFTSEMFDLTLNVWGSDRHLDRRLLRGIPSPHGEPTEFAEFGITADGRVSQVIAMGRKAEHELFSRCIEKRLQVDGNAEAIKDPQQDLSELLA